MSHLKLLPNGLNYAIKEYGVLGNLRRIMARNDDRFENYITMANRVLPNQNPLVQFLLMFSVDVEWTEDYLINVIDAKLQQNASLANLTSLYNKGKNHIGSVYPETGHNTLLVVPFGKPSTTQINGYFTKEINTLVPLFPIYTTDTKQRWDVIELINTQVSKSPTNIFSIVQIDAYALIIGFWRWLRRNVDWGNSPHGYLMNFPIMNCYLYHNELVNYNYLNSNESKISIDKGGFALEDYSTQLTDYTIYKNKYLMMNPMKSFTNFISVNQAVNISVDQDKMIFPQTYKSLFFVQMQWIWTLASLGMVRHYLEYNNFLGTEDGRMKSDINLYYMVSLQSQVNQIKSDPWKKHFLEIYDAVEKLR